MEVKNTITQPENPQERCEGKMDKMEDEISGHGDKAIRPHKERI